MMKLGYVTLYVDDIPTAIEFYEKVLGLTVRFTHESGMYAEMETGDTVLAFSHHELATQLVPQGYQRAHPDNEALGMQLGFEVENVTEMYRKALKHGASTIAPPEVKPWNFESAMIKDPTGHLVEFCKPVHAVNPS
ncbi:VOC family protein [Halodesulfovibrio sp.]|uniref:VOC family protein n=1 Tax=Halodesulfovibrio sp. TaxID=1912772 RepID=UPI0025BDCF96|nr:VOC family protein [Halodesulfovibrio sp.]